MTHTPLKYDFVPVPGAKDETYTVRVTDEDGVQRVVGQVCYYKVRHLRQYGWKALAPDVSLGVHAERWQAALALTWDRKGRYPFPFPPSRRREVEG